MNNLALRGNIFLISAPSGAGKSTLVQALLRKDPGLGLSISCTTRPPRNGEVDGEHYYFITQEKFYEMRESQDLLEWAEVYGNFYGTPRSYMEARLAKGEDILLEIDYQGAEQIRNQYPDAVDIFILPPSIEVLKTRLQNRGKDSDEVINKRIAGAKAEISHANKSQYIVLNEFFDDALQQLQSIITASRLRTRKQALRHQSVFSQMGINVFDS